MWIAIPRTEKFFRGVKTLFLRADIRMETPLMDPSVVVKVTIATKLATTFGTVIGPT